MGVFKSVSSFFEYKKPQNEEGYEFLEGPYEGQKQVPPDINNANAGDMDINQDVLVSDLNQNLQKMKNVFGYPDNQDIVIREFTAGRKEKAFLIYIDGMADRRTINKDILEPLMSKEKFEDCKNQNILEYSIENVLFVNQLTKEKYLKNITLKILNGLTAVFINNCNECLLIETRGFEKRSIDKPVTETVVQGSQEGFTENIRTNITMIRRIIKSNNLTTEFVQVGKRNNANCAILYMKSVTNMEIVNEMKRRINGIDVSFIQSQGMLSQLTEDQPLMFFPQTISTERPDRAASFLMDGKVVVFVDGSPFAEVAPINFFHFMHSSEDTNLRWQYATFLRLIRVLGLFCTMLLPALYIGLTLYHQEMIPTELLSSILKSKEQVPFPTVVEVLMLEISFELIREGGVRVPGVIGQTLGIIGALILGQAAVAAGLVNPVLIIIVAVTGLGSFSIPNYALSMGARLMRFFFIFWAAILGFYGVGLGICIIGALACSMKSFGVPFLTPVAPQTSTKKDLFIRTPMWTQTERPDVLNAQDTQMQPTNSRKWTKNGSAGDGK